MTHDVNSIVSSQDSILVLVDIQQRLSVAMPTTVISRVLEQIATLLKAASTLSIPILVTEQYPKGLGNTEAKLTNLLNKQVEIVEKTCFSCAQSATFMQQLEVQKCRQVILTGMETHICVLQTALDLQAAGFQVFVVEDAVSSRTKSNQFNALHRLRHAGVTIINVESVIFEWLGDASHPDFKALSRLVI